MPKVRPPAKPRSGPLRAFDRGPLAVSVWQFYRTDSEVWFFRAGGRDLGSWVPGTGSARVGREMRSSTDADEVVRWFLTLAGG